MTPNDFKIAVLVSGRGTNLQALIDSIERGELPARIVLVLSNKAEAPALAKGEKHSIEAVFLDPKSHPSKAAYDLAMVQLLQSRSIDMICLAGFMRILGKEFIQAFAGKIVNIHPSLLPAFPGLHPQRQALEYGAKFSGCTVHFVDETVDGGPVILQSVVPIYDTDDEETLSQRILEQEHVIYPKAIRMLVENQLHIAGRRVLSLKGGS